MKRHIPNAITSANLICGCLAIQSAITADLPLAAFFILLAAFLDFFDGLAARLLKVSSEIGAQLDSLADVVSFGVAPSFIAFSIIEQTLNNPKLAYLAFIIAISSAIRLAKFNVDDRQTDQFIGLPTPANALLWVSIVLSIWQSQEMEYGGMLADFWTEMSTLSSFNFALILVFSFMLNAELPLLSLKFKQLKWEGNQYRYILLLISMILIALFLFAAVPIILILYLFLSIIQDRRKTNTDEIQS
ncbi:MAG: CDP-diacylglycerol--serine O-phosphatidyltransferase [Flavobacteriales bacterium]|nr:CDP-diacylglycerol--serine O-phosphatidyltransferase [Flavobacteriales bacterium]|tara:strand:+ start:3051 stop:3785 length:735 start_codon:yes stop_codon:yes gene_type:complete